MCDLKMMAGVRAGQGRDTALTRFDPSSHFSLHHFLFYPFLPASQNHISLSGSVGACFLLLPPRFSSLHCGFNQIKGGGVAVSAISFGPTSDLCDF